jgi:hypothetical protein
MIPRHGVVHDAVRHGGVTAQSMPAVSQLKGICASTVSAYEFQHTRILSMIR